MRIEAGDFSYEKYGFRRAKISIPLNEDGSVAPHVENLLQRSFRHNEEANISVILYTTHGGLMQSSHAQLVPYQPTAVQPNAAEALRQTVEDSLYKKANIPMARAEIKRMSVRENIYGDMTDDQIVWLYKALPGPQPIYKSLVPLWERARFEEITGDLIDQSDHLDRIKAIFKLTGQANKERK